jgi:hypothetical protein
VSKLTIKTGPHAGTEIGLRPGVLQLGRSEANDIFVPEPSISSRHCELTVSDIGVAIRDLDSTNGTFINGQRLAKGMLQNGDSLRLGEVEFLVELADVNIAIPELHAPEMAGAAFLEDGTPACFSHRSSSATNRCTRCENWWCDECVRPLKKLSGDFLNFCPECSAVCETLPREILTRKKTLFQRIGETLRIAPKK